MARINAGLEKTIYLGNLNSKRDWGHAKDYVEMQWLMLQQKIPDDFVIATGQMSTIRDFVEMSAKAIGWGGNKNQKAIIWEGSGINETGKRSDTGEIIIRIDPRYFRPTEVNELLGDPSKAFKKLGWSPKITLSQMINEMVKKDKEDALKESILKREGFEINTSIENPPN